MKPKPIPKSINSIDIKTINKFLFFDKIRFVKPTTNKFIWINSQKLLKTKKIFITVLIIINILFGFKNKKRIKNFVFNNCENI
jgi:hypothetical protein